LDFGLLLDLLTLPHLSGSAAFVPRHPRLLGANPFLGIWQHKTELEREWRHSPFPCEECLPWEKWSPLLIFLRRINIHSSSFFEFGVTAALWTHLNIGYFRVPNGKWHLRMWIEKMAKSKQIMERSCRGNWEKSANKSGRENQINNYVQKWIT
jgi:hypothetical protein